MLLELFPDRKDAFDTAEGEDEDVMEVGVRGVRGVRGVLGELGVRGFGGQPAP